MNYFYFEYAFHNILSSFRFLCIEHLFQKWPLNFVFSIFTMLFFETTLMYALSKFFKARWSMSVYPLNDVETIPHGIVSMLFSKSSVIKKVARNW